VAKRRDDRAEDPSYLGIIERLAPASGDQQLSTSHASRRISRTIPPGATDNASQETEAQAEASIDRSGPFVGNDQNFAASNPESLRQLASVLKHV
jgi:hypothetical protein